MDSRTSKTRRSSTKSGSGKTSSSSRKVRKTKKSKSTSGTANSRSRNNDGKVSGGAVTDVTSASTSDHNTSRRRNSETESSSAATSGCCTSCVLGVLHVMDIGIGTACIVYGGMVHVVSVMATSISYGLLLVLGSVAGAIGCFSSGGSKTSTRSPGLVVSAIAGFFASLMDVAALVAILSSWNSFIDFLKDNQEDLLLTEDSIETIHGLEIPLAVIFSVLACLEMYRCIAMSRMKKTKSSSSRKRSARSGRRISQLDSISVNSDPQPRNWFLAWLGIVKKKRTDDLVLFDDNSSLESALLWSHDGDPRPDDYLVFVPEHERRLTDFTSTISLPMPPEDRMDY